MNPISIDSSIGQCQLQFKAALRNVEKAAKLAADNLLFHRCASKAYPNGDKAKFNRKSPYSPELGAHVAKVVKAVFADVFDIEGEIQTSAAPLPLTPFEQFEKDMRKHKVFSDEQIKAFWDARQQNAEVATTEPAEIDLTK